MNSAKEANFRMADGSTDVEALWRHIAQAIPTTCTTLSGDYNDLLRRVIFLQMNERKGVKGRQTRPACNSDRKLESQLRIAEAIIDHIAAHGLRDMMELWDNRFLTGAQ